VRGAAGPQPRWRDHSVSVGDGLLLGLAALALALGLSDVASVYVRPTFRPYLVAAGVVLVLLGLGCALTSWVRWARTERAMRHHEPLPSTIAIAWFALVMALVAAALVVLLL